MEVCIRSFAKFIILVTIVACSATTQVPPTSKDSKPELKQKLNNVATAFQMNNDAAKLLWSLATSSVSSTSGFSLLRGALTNERKCVSAELGRVSCHVVVRCVTDEMLSSAIDLAPQEVGEFSGGNQSENSVVVYAHGTAPQDAKQAVARAFFGDTSVTIKALERCAPPPDFNGCTGQRGPGYQCPSGMALANSNFPTGTCYEAHPCGAGESACPGESLCATIQYMNYDACGNPSPGDLIDHATLCAQGCLGSGTLVRMEKNTEKKIEEIQNGEKVWNPIQKKLVEVKHVSKGVTWEPSLELQIGQFTLSTTPTHPFKLKNGKTVMASDLKVGMLVQVANNKFEMIKDIKIKNTEMKIYNLTLEGTHEKDHWFQANGVMTGDLFLQHKLEKDRRLLP